jgi:hypothetical protein
MQLLTPSQCQNVGWSSQERLHNVRESVQETPPQRRAKISLGDPSDRMQDWRARILAAGSDEAALLQLKLAALQALTQEDSFRQAMREFRERDKRLYRVAKLRWQAARGRLRGLPQPPSRRLMIALGDVAHLASLSLPSIVQAVAPTFALGLLPKGAFLPGPCGGATTTSSRSPPPCVLRPLSCPRSTQPSVPASAKRLQPRAPQVGLGSRAARFQPE